MHFRDLRAYKPQGYHSRVVEAHLVDGYNLLRDVITSIQRQWSLDEADYGKLLISGQSTQPSPS